MRSRWVPYEQFFAVLAADRLLHWIPADDRRPEFTTLYDLSEDPEATIDRSKQRPDEVERLKEMIQDWLKRGASARSARGARSVRSEPDLEALRGLGYLDEEEH